MSKRVLVVDDEPNIVMSLEFLMRRAGFDVAVARNGREALAALDAVPPDLLLLDVMMPEFDGYEVCERVRGRPDWNGTKIIMLTARGRDIERERGLGARRRRLRHQAVLDARPGRAGQAHARRRLEADPDGSIPAGATGSWPSFSAASSC